MFQVLARKRTRHAAPLGADFLVPLLALLAATTYAPVASAAPLKTLTVGLGSGTITGTGINCGSDCQENLPDNGSVTLTAAAGNGSTFVGWQGDCTGTAACVLTTGVQRSVRAEFRLNTPIPQIGDFTPAGLQTFLDQNPVVDSAARFIAALPAPFRQNWLMMSRSESLQTGTARFPRFMLTSGDARQVFTFGMAEDSAYPGSHTNAVEYMQWDETQKNFRFHEIILANVPAVLSGGSALPLFPARTRKVSVDDIKCPRCHTTRNVFDVGIKVKNKPNWDSYDSWGGMLPFNRDRIYQGSVEAAAVRNLLNPWSWANNVPVRSFIEQLVLQPPGVPAGDVIERLSGGANDGRIRFAFDPPGTSPLSEPAPIGVSTDSILYDFNGGTSAASTVQRAGRGSGTFVTLRHSSNVAGVDEGRGVQLFDLLGGGDGNLNQRRISDEVATHRFATGGAPIDVRPVALAIAQSCFTISGNRPTAQGLAIDFNFFDKRNGMTIDLLRADTELRTKSLPRRKADIQRLNLDRANDIYYPPTGGQGLISLYGGATSFGTDTSLTRLRQEVFRRTVDDGLPDSTIMGGKYVDRELYGVNTTPMTLFRYFLEPLGVSVDKWSMGVRGRSRTYSFADIFGSYTSELRTALTASLTSEPFAGLPTTGLSDCAQLVSAVNRSFATLPGVTDPPTFTDVQRIYNKSCVECHGGLRYPPAGAGPFAVTSLDLSEDDTSGGPRLQRSYEKTLALTGATRASSYLFGRITDTSEQCPNGMMPCGGPPLSKTDIETIGRWIEGNQAFTEGDPHITTVNGVRYDFQSAGEFVLLRDEFMEIQARHVPVETAAPLAPNAHTGLSSCVSVTGAVAVRVGSQRITYQPDPLGGLIDLSILDEFGLDELGILDFGLNALSWLFNLGSPQLRVDGLPTAVGTGVTLSGGARILPTDSPGGIKIEVPGGTEIFITPGFWSYYQLWYLNLDVRHARATQGIMGIVPPNNWLPALADGTRMGPRPSTLHQRYLDLYERFTESWRVQSGKGLFDYAFGTSTNTFTLRPWPGENPTTCSLPAGTPGKPTKPPMPVIPIATARSYCQGIADAARRASCEQDVSITGNAGFTSTYEGTERVYNNRPPTIPTLLSPTKDQTGLSFVLTFNWTPVTDPEGGKVNYLHCVWPMNEPFSYQRCTPVGPTLFNPFAPTTSITYFELPCPKNYFWKVIVQDEKGASSESETRRFATKLF